VIVCVGDTLVERYAINVPLVNAGLSSNGSRNPGESAPELHVFERVPGSKCNGACGRRSQCSACTRNIVAMIVSDVVVNSLASTMRAVGWICSDIVE